ncbi:hypothetical protein G5714_013832 [Onychostoma macrolepis]|uniref:Uncharacterized protein n=1 Tax=Onychostoma macrolepis TaxID=369639 RepID=A0A7J6CG13_9TELE|nr:hypothetical protein G5714_013832 [Onychostoma macrolepis]
MVHQSATDPNSLLHPTTKLHISRYVKHLAKLLNTSSSLNTSQEKLLETQQLWHSLTEGNETANVPVVTIEPAIVNPPAPVHISDTRLHHKNCGEHLGEAAATASARAEEKTYKYMSWPVRYFYCSKKMYQSYAAEGLSNTKLPFEEFATIEFFQRELETTKKKRVEEKMQKRGKGQTPSKQAACADSATWSLT